MSVHIRFSPVGLRSHLVSGRILRHPDQVFYINPLTWAFRAAVLNEFQSPDYDDACVVALDQAGDCSQTIGDVRNVFMQEIKFRVCFLCAQPIVSSKKWRLSVTRAELETRGRTL